MVNVISLLKELCTKIKKINDEKFDVASLQNICNGKDLTLGASGADEIGSFSANAVLVGNMLRVYFSAGETDTVAGNISNLGMGWAGFKKQNRFSTVYGGRINSGTTGGIASFYLSDIIDGISYNEDNDSCVEIWISMSATHQAITSTNSYFAIPAVLDTTAF